MKIEQMIQSEIPNFERRLLFAQLLSPYDCNCDSKYGYLDGARECLESYKPIEELQAYIEEYESIEQNKTDYDKAYMLAYKDFIKQEKMKREVATNEY